jgi:sortase (surface protein transpeptidase)
VALSLTGCQIDIGSARGDGSQERRASRAAEDDPATVAEAPALSGQESVEATVAAFRESRPQPTALPPTATATWTPVPPTATPTLTPLPTATIPPTPTSDPFDAAGRPVRLEVPALGVDAFVEEVGLTADRAMDVPKGWENVGWYNRGYRPGEPGNSVIAGHLDTTSGGPAVFWDLAQLLPGDEISVTYENGDRYTFVVQETGEFDYNAEGDTIDRIFGDSPTEDLNLITCQGTWDRSSRTYDKRLVVFSTLLPERTVRANGGHGAYD